MITLSTEISKIKVDVLKTPKSFFGGNSSVYGPIYFSYA